MAAALLPLPEPERADLPETRPTGPELCGDGRLCCTKAVSHFINRRPRKSDRNLPSCLSGTARFRKWAGNKPKTPGISSTHYICINYIIDTVNIENGMTAGSINQGWIFITQR
jgi:hypothetical protein